MDGDAVPFHPESDATAISNPKRLTHSLGNCCLSLCGDGAEFLNNRHGALHQTI
jgi:hypothetical protein